jgi:N-acetylmuramoyl-L-alanine amidase
MRKIGMAMIKQWALMGLGLMLSFGLWSQGHHRVQTVVIDPGHGGKDPGCHGAFANEKDICLAIGLRLGNLIKEYFPEVKVVFTRKTDVFVELHRRAAIANQAKADLFICIHVNAASPAAFGAETYVLGLHRTKDNLSVAKRENAAVSLEDDYKKHYEGFDPNSEEANILIAMMQSAYLIQSLEFAGRVQQRFVSHAGRHDRGVRQAGFLVLVRATMPAVLIETGFATHPTEEKFLASDEGQNKMAESIFMAFADYKKTTEGKAFQGTARVFPALGTSYARGTSDSPPAPNKDTIQQAQDPEVAAPSETTQEVFFTVQCLSTRSPLPDNDPQIKSIPQRHMMAGNDGYYRYFSGKHLVYDEAQNQLQRLKSNGFPTAFLVAFRGKEKISIQEAKSILHKKD